MGFGDDQDKLAVITDGSDRMKLVAFWRNDIPTGFTLKPGTKFIRIADQIQVTAGLDPAPEFIQSEQSVVVNGYGAFVVNNIRPDVDADHGAHQLLYADRPQELSRPTRRQACSRATRQNPLQDREIRVALLMPIVSCAINFIGRSAQIPQRRVERLIRRVCEERERCAAHCAPGPC